MSYRPLMKVVCFIPRGHDDDERTPLINTSDKKKESPQSSFSAACQKSSLKCKIGLHWILGKLDMASLQSSRSQCCCCAIGVFAALFGIIMLSAGICIVLNVNYMEVDTSGLPPELDNEDGKKVVGIILICVALGTLGLSVTVSIVYFAVCNRKPRRPVTHAGHAGHGSEGGGHVGNGANHNSRSVSQTSHQRASDTSRNNSDSQLSLNSLPRHRRPSPALNGGRGATGLKKKVHKAKNHRIRHPRYQTGLPPHIEEPETGKSQVDLKLHHNRSASPSTSYTVDETQRASAPIRIPPVIVIDDSYSHSQATSSTTDPHIESADMATSFSETIAGDSLMMTEESTLYDEADKNEPSGYQYQFRQGSIDSQPENGYNDAFNHPHSIPSSEFAVDAGQLQHSQQVSTSPDVSGQPSVNDIKNNASESSSSIDSFENDSIVPRDISEDPHQSSSAIIDQNQSHQREKDNISELPTSSRHHEMYADRNENDDKRCESQSSFNSAFSNDGGDPDDEDMRKVHEKMNELLQ